MIQQVDWQAKQPLHFTGGLRLGRSKVLRSLRHYLRAQSQGHHSHQSPGGGVERGSAQRSSLRRPSSIRPTLELFQNQRQYWGNS